MNMASEASGYLLSRPAAAGLCSTFGLRALTFENKNAPDYSEAFE